MYSAQTYYDEVTLRLSRYQVSQELDPGSGEMLINLARRDVQLATIGMFPERYAEVMRLDYLASGVATEIDEYQQQVTRFGVTDTIRWYEYDLPEDFIEETAVKIKSGDAGDWWEARKVTKLELFQASRNIRTAPTEREPMYYIEKDPDSPTYKIGVSHGDLPAIRPEWVEVWYKKGLKWLQLYNASLAGPDFSDPEVVMSYEFNEMVVYQAMLRALEKMNFADQTVKQTIGNEMEQVIGTIESNYNTSVDQASLFLPSREGLYPNSAIPHVPQNGLPAQQ